MSRQNNGVKNKFVKQNFAEQALNGGPCVGQNGVEGHVGTRACEPGAQILASAQWRDFGCLCLCFGRSFYPEFPSIFSKS